MIQSVCVLGRQPALGLSELESLYGAQSVSLLAPGIAGIDLPAKDIAFARLGGSTRLATTLSEVQSTDWRLVEKELQNLLRSSTFVVPSEGKFHIGLSEYGLGLSSAKLGATALTLKKIIRARGVSVRVVLGKDPELNTAQVYHNHLTGSNGSELLIIRTDENRTLIARTTNVQNIDSYTLRDRGRPKRDAKVGMLPPKLAQILINLATGQTGTAARTEKTTAHPAPTTQSATILDPFCGTGVLLQEALLMGYNAYGTDLEPRMIDYTEQNLDWLAERFKIPYHKLEVADAITHTWNFTHLTPGLDALFVACEAYLGRPFTDKPSREILEQTVTDVNSILKKSLRNLHDQLPQGTRLCLAVPAWQTSHGNFRHLPLVDQIDDLGYNQVEFERVSSDQLLYYRDDQLVARKILVLKRK